MKNSTVYGYIGPISFCIWNKKESFEIYIENTVQFVNFKGGRRREGGGPYTGRVQVPKTYVNSILICNGSKLFIG